jgi:hypothetical protein
VKRGEEGERNYGGGQARAAGVKGFMKYCWTCFGKNKVIQEFLFIMYK